MFLAEVAAALVLLASPAGAGAQPGSAVVVIRHQTAHCHAWSVNGGPFAAAQRFSMKRGSTVTVVNDDVMPHTLLQVGGPHVTMRNGTTMPMMRGSSTPGVMRWMGSATTLTLSRPGVYRFRTHPGEDYMRGIVTTGEDNVLTLTVTVR